MVYIHCSPNKTFNGFRSLWLTDIKSRIRTFNQRILPSNSTVKHAHALTSIKQSLVLKCHLFLSCHNNNFIWIWPLLGGHLSWKTTFYLSQMRPLNTGLSVSGHFKLKRICGYLFLFIYVLRFEIKLSKWNWESIKWLHSTTYVCFIGKCLFFVQWFDVRDNFSFCWYCWPSLFKLPRPNYWQQSNIRNLKSRNLAQVNSLFYIWYPFKSSPVMFVNIHLLLMSNVYNISAISQTSIQSTVYFILTSSKELTSWVKLQVEIFWKASRRRALQKISTCSLTHDVSSLEDDKVFVLCVAFS